MVLLRGEGGVSVMLLERCLGLKADFRFQSNSDALSRSFCCKSATVVKLCLVLCSCAFILSLWMDTETDMSVQLSLHAQAPPTFPARHHATVRRL